MKRAWRGAAGLFLAVSLVTGAAGCTGDGDDGGAPAGDGTGPGVSAQDGPKGDLVGTIKHFAQSSFVFSLTTEHPQEGTVNSSGAVDPMAASGGLVSRYEDDEEPLVLEYRKIGEDRYFKVDGLGDAVPAGWMVLDPARLGPDADPAVTELAGPAAVAAALAGVVEVERSGDGTYTGTIDLTQAAESGILTEGDYAALGDRAAAVPFEATVDGEGRLTRLALDIAEGHRFDATFADWGAAPAVSAPAPDDVVPAPDEVYTFFTR